MNRQKSLNKLAVLFVLAIMLSAAIITSLLFFLFYSAGLSPFFIFSPIFSPLIALLTSSIIGTSISALVSERFLKPLHQVIDATTVISSGDFSVRVKEMDGVSEIATLLRGFNHMAKELGSIEMFRHDFINNFSHEFNTPIFSICGFAKQLRDKNLPQEKRKEYIDIIISESEKLSNMSTNILLLTDFENQQTIAYPSTYELDEQIRNCIILMEKKWSRKNLEIDLCLEPLQIFGNEEMLSHLWINLIDNAIKYSKDYGRISIVCKKIDKDVQVVIADEGIGMDNTVVKHIYEKFYKGDKSRGTHGNGLGLSIAKRIVELHHGTISVESRTGQGSTFTVLLPD